MRREQPKDRYGRPRSLGATEFAGLSEKHMFTIAVGTLIGPHAPCAMRSGSGPASVPAVVRHRCIVGNNTPYPATTATMLVAPCVDAPHPDRAKQRSCSCKLVFWFRTALTLYPDARYIAKVEDDTIVHWSALARALRTHERSSASAAMVWAGHFQWAAHDASTGRGRFCGEGDAFLSQLAPSGCVVSGSTNVLAPFATGAFDVRSRDLATATAAVGESLGSCDGGEGYRVARAIARPNATSTATLALLHLRQRHFGRTPRNGLTVVAHPQKDYARRLSWQVSPSVADDVMACMLARLSSNRARQTVLEWRPCRGE